MGPLLLCLLLAPQGAVVEYDLPHEAKVSLSIYDAQGAIVRELLHQAPRSAGPQLEYWSGRDADGDFVAADTYTWKLIATPGLQAEFLATLGNSYPDGPEHFAGAPGSHGAALDVEVDSTGVYLSGMGGEAFGTHMFKMTHDGSTRLWTVEPPEPAGGIAEAALDDDGFLFTYVSSPLRHRSRVHRYDATTGERLNNFKVLLPGFDWDGSIDAYRGKVVVSYPGADRIRVFDGRSGQLLRDFTGIPHSGRISLDAQGRLFFIEGLEIHSIDLTAAQPTPVPVITSGLVMPYDLDVDRTTGQILVSDFYPSSQIKRFDAAGNLLATYGRLGGRTNGLYAPEKHHFLNVASVSHDPTNGGFYTTGQDWQIPGHGIFDRSAPRRTARWDAQGNWIQEWVGGQTWTTFNAPRPDDPGVVWMASEWNCIMRLEVDLESGEWEVHSTYNLFDAGNTLVDRFFIGEQYGVRRHQGRTYLVREIGTPAVYLVDETNWTLRPLLLTGHNLQWAMANDPDQVPLFIQTHMGTYSDSYIWRDGNGDGIEQPQEVSFSRDNYRAYGMTVDPQLNCWLYDGLDETTFLLPTGPIVQGVPQYPDFPNPIPVASGLSTPSFVSGWVYPDLATGELWGVMNHRNGAWGGSRRSFLQKWDDQGTPKHMSGLVHEGNASRGMPEGAVGTFRRILGVVHGNLFATDYNGGWYSLSEPAPTYGWTSDGLWVGGLLDDPDTSVHPWGTAKYGVGGENLGGNVVEDPASEDVFYFASGENMGPLYRIRGWNGWVEQQGTVDLLQPGGFGVGLRAAYFEDTELEQQTDLRIDPTVDFQWGSGVPAGTSILTPSEYSVRWSGEVTPIYDEYHRFRITTQGGLRLTVDGRTLIDDWQVAAQARTLEGGLPMRPGQRYEFQLEFLVDGCPGDITVEWNSDQRPYQVLPQLALFPSSGLHDHPAGHGDGLLFELYQGHDFAPQDLITTGTVDGLDRRWSMLPPGLQPGQDYGLRLLGRVTARQDGFHTFLLEEFGLQVDATLWVDHEQLFTSTETGSLVFPVVNEGAKRLQAGVPEDLQLDIRFTAAPDAILALHWVLPDMPDAEADLTSHSIPQAQLDTDYRDNALPSVGIRTLHHGSSHPVGTFLTATADASDRDGVITEVHYHLNGALLGTRTTSPYTLDLGTQLAPGTYRLTAIAVDDDAAERASRPVVFTVE